MADILLGYEIKVTLNIISIAFQIHGSRIYFEVMATNPMNYRFLIGEILLSDGGGYQTQAWKIQTSDLRPQR